MNNPRAPFRFPVESGSAHDPGQEWPSDTGSEDEPTADGHAATRGTPALSAAAPPGDAVTSTLDLPGPSATPADAVDRLRDTLSRYGFRVQSNVIFKYEGHVATLWGGCRPWSVPDAARRVAARTANRQLKDQLAAILAEIA